MRRPYTALPVPNNHGPQERTVCGGSACDLSPDGPTDWLTDPANGSHQQLETSRSPEKDRFFHLDRGLIAVEPLCSAAF